MDAQAGVEDVVKILERLGQRGVRRLVLDPSSVRLIKRLNVPGNSGAIWRGELDGEQVGWGDRARTLRKEEHGA
jgi:hypothetical protein